MSNGNNNGDGDGDNDNDDDPLSGYKLCGYFIPILTVVSHSQTLTLIPGSPISLSDLGFRSDSGISLLPITNPNPNPDNNTDVDTPSPSKRKRRRKSGLVVVNGSVSASVVHQLHALVSGGCFKIRARVLRVSVREESARAAVLVDVYLPVEAWTGWQFPRARAVVVSFFKHVSCDWETRSSFLVLNENATHIDDERIWSCYDCHVFGCVLHCNSSGSGDKRSFDLPEIFKSLPTAGMAGTIPSTRIKPDKASSISPGIWDIADDVLTKILMMLGPRDLFSVSATCHHLRALTASVMPCMKLKLFPHQEAAVEWMLRREHNTEVLSHPLYMSSVTEDGLPLFLNVVSGELSTGVAPTVNDFRGGMFCDEPGLGKTITALSLILKTYGTLAEPPQGVDVVWCMRDANRGCGYYELSADNLISHNFMSTWKRLMSQNVRRGQACSSESTPELSSGGISKSSSQSISMSPELSMNSIAHSVPNCKSAPHMPVTRILRCTRSSSLVQRNLLDTYGKTTDSNSGFVESDDIPRSKSNAKRRRKHNVASSNSSETWVQCDACRKWRKLCEKRIIDASAAWFCRMNIDSLHQSCASPEEAWNKKRKITFLPGFYVKGSPQGSKENISFFTGVLKENITLLDSETRKALTWLANLSHNKLVEMETVGLRRPVVLDAQILSDERAYGYHKIFRAFGLVRKVERGTSRWFYPSTLDNLELDLTALRIALTYPLDSLRLYLSRATLIVVPANLVDHWKTQIQEHVSPGQLRVYIWADHRKPDAHNLAWDYDIVITTFSRLSAEWGLRKRSVLMQIHWIRVMLDEGHTLGSSLSLTNKLQMAISLTATNRWILTGTPTPDTPNSQVAYLQPMLKFLHEEAYGQNQESWEAGILKPFEDQMEEGRSRLLDLLRRIMTCARKEDLRNIPPCVKKATYLHFTEEHAKSYNELVVTVRRNILMADWNDPSHVESLLNPKQWKFRSKTIRNVRLSCCVAGHIKVTDAGQDIQETMDLLVQEGLDPLSEEHAIIRISLLDGCSCVRCKNWCRLPVITPCRHLLCLDCVALDSEKCTYPGCGNPYEMQAPEVLTRPENPNPKWPVPKDLIELQPSYEQDDWNPDWQSTSSSKVAYLVKRLKDLQEPNNKIQSRNIGLHTEINDYSLLEDNGSEIMTNVHSSKLLPDKVIIFSQFLEHIHVIEQQLTFAGIRFAGMYNPMPSNLKKKSLMIFQNDPNCMVLLMDGSAALGLDLSFVTHVFLMEPIWDRSMEEQVISRAHRMGATRPIHVETLVMHGTIEEQMVDFLQDIAMSKQTLNQEIYGTNNEGARAYRTLHDFAENNYLSQLTFVRTNAA